MLFLMPISGNVISLTYLLYSSHWSSVLLYSLTPDGRGRDVTPLR